jgi:RND family efflux transporter MFP subunit
MRRSAKRLLATALLLTAIVTAAFLAGRATRQNRPASGRQAASSKTMARYRCPMHPAMVSDQPGDCPICGMRMVPIESASGKAEQGTITPTGSGKKVFYRSTMNPAEVSDKPGKDAMGMEMERVEVDAEPSPGESPEGLAAVRIPERKQQLIGVKTSVVGLAPFVRDLKTVGRVIVDETRIHHVHTKIEGWVDTLRVNATGEKVGKGQPLLSIYSPELLATQEEYLLAWKARRSLGADASPEALRRAEDLVQSSRRRLLLYDFSARQIDELEQHGAAMRAVTLYAPMSGFIMQRNVTQGERITPESNLLDIADLSKVWVLASIYEYEAPFVKVGQSATMALSYQPGKRYQGKVTLVYPILEEGSRTLQARLEFANPSMELKPEMFADVTLHADVGERLAVPDSAVISTGVRSIVFVERERGVFEPREVRLGLRLGDSVEVIEGLHAGESIVTSGNFLVDSESKLKSALEAAAAPPAPTQTAPSRKRR